SPICASGGPVHITCVSGLFFLQGPWGPELSSPLGLPAVLLSSALPPSHPPPRDVLGRVLSPGRLAHTNLPPASDLPLRGEALKECGQSCPDSTWTPIPVPYTPPETPTRVHRPTQRELGASRTLSLSFRGEAGLSI
ncbi:hypothetical protein H1C71_008047, partial [Ictidomys tridecemlineatus]